MVELPDWAGWADTGESDWTWLPDPKTKACLATLVQSVSFCCTGSLRTLPKMAAGGKAYGSSPSHDRLRASTVHAWRSGTGETNCRSLLLNLEANGSTWSLYHRLHIAWKTSGLRDHPVLIVWPSLDSLSAIMFRRPGMCRALRVTVFLVHQASIHSRAHKGARLHSPLLVHVSHH